MRTVLAAIGTVAMLAAVAALVVGWSLVLDWYTRIARGSMVEAVLNFLAGAWCWVVLGVFALLLLGGAVRRVRR